MEAARPATAESVRFGALLKRYRIAASLSQAALAERARLSERAISAYERGQRQAPYRDTVTLLAEALGLSTQETATLEATVPRRRGPVERPAPTASGGSEGVPALVGRARELAVLERHLAGEAHRCCSSPGSRGSASRACCARRRDGLHARGCR